jgi:hypothetical protein
MAGPKNSGALWSGYAGCAFRCRMVPSAMTSPAVHRHWILPPSNCSWSGAALGEAAQPFGSVLARKHRRQQIPQVRNGGLLGLGAARPGAG